MDFRFAVGEVAIHQGAEVKVLIAGGDGGDYLVDAGRNDVFWVDESELSKK